jgi:hypothetical protein
MNKECDIESRQVLRFHVKAYSDTRPAVEVLGLVEIQEEGDADVRRCPACYCNVALCRARAGMPCDERHYPGLVSPWLHFSILLPTQKAGCHNCVTYSILSTSLDDHVTKIEEPQVDPVDTRDKQASRQKLTQPGGADP